MRRAVDPMAVDDAAALAKRARHQRWLWCRLENGFFDNAIFRVVSELTGLPLFQVQAFVGRLECLANASEPRGYVGDFRAIEFGAAMGMPADQAARIFAALEHADVAWVDQDHVVTFDGRNPDRPDVTAPERGRRRKARQQVRKYVDKRLELGHVTEEQRDGVCALLGVLADRELFQLRDKLRAGIALEAALSTAQGHGVTVRDSVTGHARAEHSRSQNSSAAVDNSGDATRGEAAGLAEDQPAPDDAQSTEAELWLRTDAVRIVVERMGVVRTRAETLIERWRRDLDQDAIATATILRSCDEAKLVDARFHVAVTEHIRRCALAKLNGGSLPLPPVRAAGTDPQARRHAVATPAVDNTPAESPAPSGLRSGTDG